MVKKVMKELEKLLKTKLVAGDLKKAAKMKEEELKQYFMKVCESVDEDREDEIPDSVSDLYNLLVAELGGSEEEEGEEEEEKEEEKEEGDEEEEEEEKKPKSKVKEDKKLKKEEKGKMKGKAVAEKKGGSSMSFIRETVKSQPSITFDKLLSAVRKKGFETKEVSVRLEMRKTLKGLDGKKAKKK